MPRYYRRYRRYTRRGRGYKRSSRSRAIGNMRAAYAQKDTASVVLNINRAISCSRPDISINQPSFKGAVGVLNIYDCLVKSEFFRNYAPMYDQFKVDRVRVKLTALKFPVQNTGNNTVGLSIVTAWDRNGLDNAQISNDLGITPVGEAPDVTYYLNSSISNVIGANVNTYSSAVTKNLVVGSSFNQTRYLNASSMQEKEQYLATDDLKEWYLGALPEDNILDLTADFKKIVPYSNVQAIPVEVKNSLLSEQRLELDKNPAYFGRSSTCPFKPTLLIGVNSGGEDAVQYCTFNAEIDVAVTFRGLRKSSNV